MGKHVEEAVEGMPSIRTIKVHARMCSQLIKLVIRVANVFPEVEEARPRCSSGIEALCLLNNGISKGKSLLKQCSESSALYLALTGDVILTRCKKSSNMMEQSLSQIQNMVPVALAAKISGIIADLRSASYCLDPSEEEAGKILRELIHRYSSKVESAEYTTVADMHAVTSRLRITSQKALVIEKRSIMRLHDLLGESDLSKKKILMLFLKLLKKYGNIISKEQRDNCLPENEDSVPVPSPYHLSNNIELRVDYKPYESRIDVLSRPVPPEEFLCPLSLRLMSDPVVIASGQTYERIWIKKWFDEGQNTCPKTNMTLENFSFTPNTGMKLLIQKWCSMHNVSVPDQNIRESQARSLDISTTSIASLSSSMNDMNLQLDYSNVSLGSSQCSDSAFSKMTNYVEPSYIDTIEFFKNFDSLPWDSRCKAIKDVKMQLDHSDETWSTIPLEMLITQIVTFLNDSHGLHDVEALMTGCLFLLEAVQKQRNSMKYINEDTYVLLASILDTEVALQALSILDVLSSHRDSDCKITNSGALIAILNILDSQIQVFQEPALSILANLSSNGNLHTFTVPSELIPKLIPLMEDNVLSRYCIRILRNLRDNEDGRRSIAETDNCIASIAKLLEKESREEQEHAVSVLLALCSQRVEYCKLVMDEGVIPGLVSVCVNGNDKAKAMATELLRILRIESEAEGEIYEKDLCTGSTDNYKQQKDKNTPKAPGLFKKIFSKPTKKK